MKKMILCALALLLVMPVFASQEATVAEDFSDGYSVEIPMDWSLEELMDWYITQYGLTEDNFAISVYLPVSGERYAYNENKMMFAASTYKLPLNMYYYEQQNAGVYSDNTIVGGATLATDHYESIINSNNELSHAMIYNLGSFYQYKVLMLEHYGNIPLDELDVDYWADNYYNTRFMCNTLEYLYEHQEDFAELVGYLKQAMPGQYLQSYAGDVAVAHKYGIFFDPTSVQNDVGILFTEEPVLVAIFTSGYFHDKFGGDELIGRLGKALIEYQGVQLERARLAAEESERVSESVRASEEAEQARLESEALASEQASAEASVAMSEAERMAIAEAAAAMEASVAASESEAAAAEAEAQQQQNRRTVLILIITAGAVLALTGVKILLKQKKQAKVG